MPEKKSAPDGTAERVALWRALHVEVDAAPHVFEDEVGLRLADPEGDWRSRPDMDPVFTRGFRAAIVARARFVEDLVAQEVQLGITQYVLLGAGLDTFAQRRPEIASRIRVFEIDRPDAQTWKRERLMQLGFGIPGWLRMVAVDFETEPWTQRLEEAGFDPTQRTVVASTGVSMYLSAAANEETLHRVASFAPGSVLAMTFLLPADLLDPEDRPGLQMAQRGARASGTPFLSFFTPSQAIDLALRAGFREARHVPLSTLATRYFSTRTDGFRPTTGEDLLVAVV